MAAGLSFSQNEKPSAACRHVTTSDGVKLYFEVRGKGTPCLYLHGGPGSGSYWLEKFSGDMLEKYFQMIYLDQRGVARSGSPKDGNYSMDRMVQDFEEIRAALGIRKWVILGHSFGGILQVGYAERHPQVIKGMIMLNCSLDLNATLQETLPHACELLNMSDAEPCTNSKMPLLDRVQVVYGKLREKDLFWKMAYASRQSSDMLENPQRRSAEHAAGCRFQEQPASALLNYC
jgi:proline iminopeptidase